MSLVTFVRVRQASGNLKVTVTVRTDRGSSRQMSIRWDERELAAYHTGTFSEGERDCWVNVLAPTEEDVYELRVTGNDGRPVQVRRITVTGEGDFAFEPKPGLPAGGSLDVLSACYMPDPSPLPGSQTVTPEGKYMSLYQDHAEFGALRIVLRNTGDVPVRINDVQLNGKPVEEKYIDFLESEWDTRGVVWYRVRSRLLAVGQCAEALVRFRRRPEGETATVTIGTENAGFEKVWIAYEDPELSVDYVTTDETMRRLYLYARRSGSEGTGKLERVSLDCNHLENAVFFGPDFLGGVALTVADLAEPLVVGDYHVVGIEADGARRVDAQCRVLSYTFPRSSIHAPPERLKSMHMNWPCGKRTSGPVTSSASTRLRGSTSGCTNASVFSLVRTSRTPTTRPGSLQRAEATAGGSATTPGKRSIPAGRRSAGTSRRGRRRGSSSTARPSR